MSDHPRPSSLELKEQGATGHVPRYDALDSVKALCEKELEKFTDLKREVKERTRITVQQVMEMRVIVPASDSSGVNSNFLTLPGTKEGNSPGKGKKGSLNPSPLSSGFAEMRPTADGTPKDHSPLAEGDAGDDESLETPDEEKKELAKLARATLLFVEDSLLKAQSPEEVASLLEGFLKKVEDEFDHVKSDVVAGMTEFCARARARKYTIWTTMKMFVPCL